MYETEIDQGRRDAWRALAKLLEVLTSLAELAKTKLQEDATKGARQ